MIVYYLKLALRSLLGTPTQTAVTLLAIGLGIAVPTAMLSVHHVFAQNPLPEKSNVLFNVRVDSWDPNSQFFDVEPGDPPKHITYQDMDRLLKSQIPSHASGVSGVANFVFPGSPDLQPYQARMQLVHHGFFPMFDLPFRFGSGWASQADAQRQRVVVISQDANQKLFSGENSVGRTLRIGQNDFTVVGVLGPYNPTPVFFDVIRNQMGPPLDFYLPFDVVRDPSLGFTISADTDSWGPPPPEDDPDASFTMSERTWIQYWVELPPGQLQAYRDYVDSYTLGQKELGRFPRPLNNRVTPLMEWMEVRNVVPPVSVALVWISLLFLVVCCLNLVGLLLSRFLASAPQLGVHRALGASRSEIFLQRLLECELVGAMGGLAGIALASLALVALDHSLPDRMAPPGTFGIDGYSLLVAFTLSLIAGLLSGLYPAWRACRVAPAHQLKLQ
ncbi:MAG: ABC transporter permease [Thermoanaerobaculia bacterium]|nr:ABC transporter permease [Thermoanaerobaculia bacterium]